MSLSISVRFWWLLNKKAARFEVILSLAFLVSDIAIFVLKGDVKLQQTN